MAEVAILVLNFNGKHLLEECLTSLHRLTIPVDVYVVDNGSTDGSSEFLGERFPEVRLIELGRNCGFAAGYNQAVREVSHRWVTLLNNDAALAPGWLEAMLQASRHEPRAAILGGKLLFRGGAGANSTVQSAGASFTEAGTAFEIGWGEPDRGQYDRASRRGAVSGAAMLLRREVFLELGGFDPEYFAYLEDVDLCWRAWLAGHEVLYRPEAVAYHHFGASHGGRASPLRIRWMQRNRLANMGKNLEARSFPRAWAVSLAYDAYRVLEYSRSGQWAALRALAHGTVAFWKDSAAVFQRRAAVQRSRKVSDRALREMGQMASARTAFQEYRRLGRLSQEHESA